MAGNDDVSGVAASLKHSGAWKGVADAISVRADRTTERHVFGDVDGNKPIRPIKDFVPTEATSGDAQRDYQTSPSFGLWDHILRSSSRKRREHTALLGSPTRGRFYSFTAPVSDET
jgi:hypothetical protein